MRGLALTAILVLAAEAGARHLVASATREWQYWEPAAAVKFEAYRTMVDRGAPPEVLVVGDSTAARDIDPRVLQSSLGAEAFSLAWPGMFARAFGSCLIPALEEAPVKPKLLIASFSPSAFTDGVTVRRFEQPILASPFCRQFRHPGAATHDSALVVLRRVMYAARSRVRSGDASLLGFMPLNEVPSSPPGPMPEKPAELSKERLQVLDGLVESSQRLGYAVVIVIPPRLGVFGGETEYAAYLERLASRGAVVFDGRDAAESDPRAFWDPLHLTASGAARFSTSLGAFLRQHPTTSRIWR